VGVGERACIVMCRGIPPPKEDVVNLGQGQVAFGVF